MKLIRSALLGFRSGVPQRERRREEKGERGNENERHTERATSKYDIHMRHVPLSHFYLQIRLQIKQLECP